jgi:hypothetical protein
MQEELNIPIEKELRNDLKSFSKRLPDSKILKLLEDILLHDFSKSTNRKSYFPPLKVNDDVVEWCDQNINKELIKVFSMDNIHTMVVSQLNMYSGCRDDESLFAQVALMEVKKCRKK